MSLPAVRCGTCVHFKPKGQKCRRYPPAIVYDIALCTRVTAFPQVNEALSCGEWKLNNTPDETEASKTGSQP